MHDYSIKDIPIGRENAISRANLAKKWECTDRTARERISILRCKPCNDGLFICSHSCGGVKGYYRSGNPEEIRHFVHEGRKRLKNTAAPIINANRLLKAKENEAAYGKGLGE